jgi:hypothetical protein
MFGFYAYSPVQKGASRNTHRRIQPGTTGGNNPGVSICFKHPHSELEGPWPVA